MLPERRKISSASEQTLLPRDVCLTKRLHQEMQILFLPLLIH
jgi:hypothetical protein